MTAWNLCGRSETAVQVFPQLRDIEIGTQHSINKVLLDLSAGFPPRKNGLGETEAIRKLLQSETLCVPFGTDFFRLQEAGCGSKCGTDTMVGVIVKNSRTARNAFEQRQSWQRQVE
jgi:hypothetical protein